jgi:hypothetical protein
MGEALEVVGSCKLNISSDDAMKKRRISNRFSILSIFLPLQT